VNIPCIGFVSGLKASVVRAVLPITGHVALAGRRDGRRHAVPGTRVDEGRPSRTALQ